LSLRRATLLGFLAALLGCAPAGAPGASRAPGDVCVALFRHFDVLENLFPNNQSRYQNRVARPRVEAQAQRLRSAGCLTLTRDLAGMEGAPQPPVGGGGAAIPPISLHAGVVTSMEDDARSRAFFASRGVPARSVGSAPLGRRIYLGPFATQGALDGARTLALDAGFASPYPAQF
jgi:hypothetical protein